MESPNLETMDSPAQHGVFALLSMQHSLPEDGTTDAKAADASDTEDAATTPKATPRELVEYSKYDGTVHVDLPTIKESHASISSDETSEVDRRLNRKRKLQANGDAHGAKHRKRMTNDAGHTSIGSREDGGEQSPYVAPPCLCVFVGSNVTRNVLDDMSHNIGTQPYTGSGVYQAFASLGNEEADFAPAPPENLASSTVGSASSGASPDADATEADVETDVDVDPESYEKRHPPSSPFPRLDTWEDTELENPCPRCLTDHVAIDEMNEACSNERPMCKRKRRERRLSRDCAR